MLLGKRKWSLIKLWVEYCHQTQISTRIDCLWYELNQQLLLMRSHIYGLIPMWAKYTWVYFFSQICYHNNLLQCCQIIYSKKYIVFYTFDNSVERFGSFEMCSICLIYFASYIIYLLRFVTSTYAVIWWIYFCGNYSSILG